MKEVCLQDLQKIELGILVYIDQVCKEHNLKYFLCGGTLLGAIRHKGFIPWDDDIDICMPRPDYDKFIEILKHAEGKYKILYPGQKDYYYNFAKLVDSETILNEYTCQPIDNMGVYVDIFPIEGMPLQADARQKHYNKLNRLRKRINAFSLLKPRIRKNVIKYLQSFILYKMNKKDDLLKYQQEYERLAKQYDYDASEYTYMSGGAYAEKEIFPKYVLNSYEKRFFEGREFNIIKEYDVYLTQLYGDYMKLPPKEKQVTHHRFTVEYKHIEQTRGKI